MKPLYIAALIGLVLVGCARHEPTITLCNESKGEHIAYLHIDEMQLVAYPHDTDTENIEPGTYCVDISIYDGLQQTSLLLFDTVTITDNITCIVMRDGEPVTWQ